MSRVVFSLFHAFGYILKRMKLCKKRLYNVALLRFERCICISGASVNSNENGICISEFADLEFKDLNSDGKTCCSASQMHSASVALENLAGYLWRSC